MSSNFFLDLKGSWRVSGSSLDIDAKSGVAIAVSLGTSVVYFNIGTLVTYTEVSWELFNRQNADIC